MSDEPQNQSEETLVSQDLIVRSAGFLRVPRAFRKKYPNCIGKETATPIATERYNQDGTISLIYTWKKDELKEREVKTKEQKPKKE